MIKRALSNLILFFMVFYSSVLMAERPAEIDETVPATEMPQNNSEMNDEGRPAADDLWNESASTQEQPVKIIEQRGDVLGMPATQQDVSKVTTVSTLDFPRRGMSQDKVQNELGRPIEIIPPVGQPPITRWVYDDRIVYFEYSSVIHVVAK